MVICMAMTCMFGAWEIFEGCSLKPKSSFIVLHHSLPIHKTMEQHWASRVLHVTEPTCTDAVFIKYWSGCVRMRAWKPQLRGKLQLQEKKQTIKLRLSWTTLKKHYSETHSLAGKRLQDLWWGFKVMPVHSDPKVTLSLVAICEYFYYCVLHTFYL